jgi:hypothetical protein
MRSSVPAIPSADSAPAEQRPLLRLIYEYIGQTALTVSSPYTGRRYRFDRPGARVELDPRDRSLVARLEQLRQIT